MLIKHFELPTDENDPSKTTRLETRFVILGRGGEYSAITYRWNDAQTDAVLLNGGATRNVTIQTANGNTRTQTWSFPSRAQCFSCHTEEAGKVLGVNTQQLNGPMLYPSTGITANQLDTWKHLGIFQQNVEAAQHYTRGVPVGVSNASLQHQVKSYLDANCSFCHRPNGVEANFDARLATPLASASILNSRVVGSASTPGNVIVQPGNPSESELFVRSISSAGNLMPPIGRSELDDTYIQTLQSWIENMIPPASFGEIGETGEVETNEKWKTVTLSRVYENPVVIVGPPSYEGGEQASVRIRNVQPGSFEIKVDEWEICLDQFHAFEKISYLVVEAGTYKLPNGKIMMAGNTELTHRWKTINFYQRFTSDPVILASCTSENEADAVVVRIDEAQSSNDRFTLRLQEQQGGGSIKPSEISFDGRIPGPYLSKDTLAVDRKESLLGPKNQPDPKLAFLQEQSLLNAHAPETVGWIAIEPGTNTLGGEFEVGSYDQVSNNWADVSFAKFYSAKPLVLAGMGSYRDADPAGLRYDIDKSHGGLLRIFAEEDPCGDTESTHSAEKLNYIVGEMGIRLYGEKISEIGGSQNRFTPSYLGIAYENPSFSVFPNPTRGKLFVDMKGLHNQEFTLTLFNASGKAILQKTYLAGIQFLQLPELPQAVYFLQVRSDGLEETRKLIVH